MEKKIVYVDMDGVVADFDKKMFELCPELDIKEGVNWDERSREVDKICLLNPHIFLNLELIKGALEAIKQLNEKYEIYFLSSPMWALPECFMDKRKWLEKYFGDLAKHKLILTKRKDLNIGDYLIDDTTRNGAGEFKGKHIMFGSKEFPDWEAVIKHLT